MNMGALFLPCKSRLPAVQNTLAVSAVSVYVDNPLRSTDYGFRVYIARVCFT